MEDILNSHIDLNITKILSENDYFRNRFESFYGQKSRKIFNFTMLLHRKKYLMGHSRNDNIFYQMMLVDTGSSLS